MREDKLRGGESSGEVRKIVERGLDATRIRPTQGISHMEINWQLPFSGEREDVAPMGISDRNFLRMRRQFAQPDETVIDGSLYFSKRAWPSRRLHRGKSCEAIGVLPHAFGVKFILPHASRVIFPIPSQQDGLGHARGVEITEELIHGRKSLHRLTRCAAPRAEFGPVFLPGSRGPSHGIAVHLWRVKMHMGVDDDHA